ncbi:hypothetical protein IMSHALPRED_010566 [Imshaugia aleurites]|uniref:Uncharacterized protein n=1 Tax=Imshaugia aleurites TaxID=172621 RepID=A0A8H3EU94_9LECA|nr:hypothetical protein IMSHALPRED_010566 [Imshaugia aleurites]
MDTLALVERCWEGVTQKATVFNDHDQSTNQIGTYNVTTPVTALALTPGTLILTIVGNRFLQTSSLNFALTNKAGIIIQANESSIQASSPNAYCDSNNTYTSDTRLVNCYFFTNPSVTLGKSCLHVSQSFQCKTALVSGRCTDSSSPSQVTLSLYDYASQTTLVSGPGQQVTGSKFFVTVSVTDPLSTDSSMDFTYHNQASGKNRLLDHFDKSVGLGFLSAGRDSGFGSERSEGMRLLFCSQWGVSPVRGLFLEKNVHVVALFCTRASSESWTRVSQYQRIHQLHKKPSWKRPDVDIWSTRVDAASIKLDLSNPIASKSLFLLNFISALPEECLPIECGRASTITRIGLNEKCGLFEPHSHGQGSASRSTIATYTSIREIGHQYSYVSKRIRGVYKSVYAQALLGECVSAL